MGTDADRSFCRLIKKYEGMSMFYR